MLLPLTQCYPKPFLRNNEHYNWWNNKKRQLSCLAKTKSGEKFQQSMIMASVARLINPFFSILYCNWSSSRTKVKIIRLLFICLNFWKYFLLVAHHFLGFIQLYSTAKLNNSWLTHWLNNSTSATKQYPSTNAGLLVDWRT